MINTVAMGKLENSEIAKEYKRWISEKWEEWRGFGTEDVETEWEGMKVAVKEIA